MYKKYFISALLLQILILLGSIPFIYFLFQQPKGLPSFLKTNIFFVVFILSALAQIGNLFFFTLLIAAQKLKVYALANIFNSVFTLVMVFIAIRHNSYTACVALLLSPLGIFLFVFFKIQNLLKTTLPLSLKNYSFKAFKNLSHFLLAAGSALVFGRVVEFFVRVFALSRFDPYQIGLWQSAVKLSDGYTSLFSGIVGAVFYPKIASLINNNHNVRQTFLKMSSIIAIIVFAGLFLIFIFQKMILSIVFNDAFIQAKLFLDYQLVSDAFKFISWLMVYLVVARAQMRLYLLLEFISASVYILMLVYFTGTYGTIGLAFANLGRYIIYFSISAGITVYYFTKGSKPEDLIV